MYSHLLDRLSPHALSGSFLLLALGLGAATGCRGPATAEERAHELYGYCEHCHGLAGEGNLDFRVPPIAGLDAWYVEATLHKFRIGARGDHPDDVDGLRMRPMSRTLATDEEVRLVAGYVAGLEPVTPPRLVEGDASHGAALYKPCVQCHGDRAAGRRDMNAPALAGLLDLYMFKQLQKFKSGVRGSDPLDTTGAQMRPNAQQLEDEQAMRDVIAHIKSFE